MAHTDKVIVTNVGAMKVKYGSGYSQITKAVRRLVAADKKRGLKTRLVALDNSRSMKLLKAKPVLDARDCRQNKTAIDGVFAALTPDYLVLLGAVDVIPHQDLVNPVPFDPEGDADRTAWSDLPYACEAPYSIKVADFRGPTRVVGRIPDLTGGTDPAYLVRLLDTAATYQTRSRSEYESYLGLTASVWKGSTALSLLNTFGNSTDLKLAPPDGPNWPAAAVGRRSHFINCHGGAIDPFYYGQKGNHYPVSHAAEYVDGKISEGTVAAAECCYGAELYDPSLLDSRQAGICNTYLKNKAYGFFGSTTIAYGPSEGNGEADLLCQYFMQSVLAGASLGRAALEARQRFVRSDVILEPTSLKTLAQFNLMGDPAVHPVSAPTHALNQTKGYQAALKKGLGGQPAARTARRELLIRAGQMLRQTVGAVQRAIKVAIPAAVKKAFEQIAKESQMGALTLGAFTVPSAGGPLPKGAKGFRALAPKKREVYVAVGKRKETPDKVTQVVVLSALVEQGKVVRLRRLHSR